MHHIHTTYGLIIGSRPYGEADKLLSIFTRDLGLVSAVAQGIRLQRSKLRSFTQDYSFGSFSFVKGREFWRLVDVRALGNPASNDGFVGSQSGSQCAVLARLAALLRRLLHGEEAHPELFDNIRSCADFLNGDPVLTTDQMNILESVTVVRLLYNLGYIGEIPSAVQTTDISITLLDSLAEQRSLINQHINKALRESHL